MQYGDLVRTTAISSAEGRIKADVSGKKKKKVLLKKLLKKC